MHHYARANYNDISSEKGSKLSVVQGTNTGTVGNIALSINRDYIAGSTTLNIDAAPGIFNGSQAGVAADTIVVSVFNTTTFNSIETDGTQVTIAGVTGTASGSINGGTWYVKTIASEDPFGDGTAVYLYTDAATTTRASASAIGLTGFTTGGGTIEYTVTGTAAKEWEFELEQSQGDLKLKSDDTTKVTFGESGNILTVAGNVSATYYKGDGSELTNVVDIASTETITGAKTLDDATLKKFKETLVALGNQTGDISSQLDANNGSIYTVTATGDLTIDSIANVQTGTSMTIKVVQDGTGGHLLSSTMKFAGAEKTLSTAPSAIDVISVFYDGSDYLASLTKGYA